MVSMPQLPRHVRLAGPDQRLSHHRIEHASDGTGRALAPHGRPLPKLDMRRTDLSLHSGMAARHADLLEREAELEALATLLAEASDGRGGVVVVTGEAGIGKSTLVSHFVAGLAERARSLVGSCDDLS